MRIAQPPAKLRDSPDIAQTVAAKAAGFPGNPGARKRPAEDSATAGGSNGAGAAVERDTGELTQPVPSDAELRRCLEILAGTKGADSCLPFSAAGRAKGQLDDQDMGDRHPLHWQGATQLGAHVKQVPQTIMRHLLRGECFTADGIAFMDQWVTAYSVVGLLSDDAGGTPRPESPSPSPSPASAAERRAVTGKAPAASEPVVKQLAPLFNTHAAKKPAAKQAAARKRLKTTIDSNASGQASAASQDASEGNARCARFGVWTAFACHVTLPLTPSRRAWYLVSSGYSKPDPKWKSWVWEYFEYNENQGTVRCALNPRTFLGGRECARVTLGAGFAGARRTRATQQRRNATTL